MCVCVQSQQQCKAAEEMGQTWQGNLSTMTKDLQATLLQSQRLEAELRDLRNQVSNRNTKMEAATAREERQTQLIEQLQVGGKIRTYVIGCCLRTCVANSITTRDWFTHVWGTVSYDDSNS